MCPATHRCWRSPDSPHFVFPAPNISCISQSLQHFIFPESSSAAFDGILFLAAFHQCGTTFTSDIRLPSPRSCCSLQHPRSAGGPGHVEDGATRARRDSRAVTVMMKTSAPACQAWAHHRAVNAYASSRVRPIC